MRTHGGHGVACLCAQVTSLPLWLDHFHLILPVRWCFGRLSAEAHSYYSSTVPFHKHPQVGGMFNESSPPHTPLWSITCQLCGLRNSSPFVNATTWMIQNTSYIDGRVCEPSSDKFAMFSKCICTIFFKTLHCFHLLRNWNTTNQSSSQKKKLAIFRGGFCTVPKNAVVCSGIEAIGCIVGSVSFGLLACRTEKHLDRATSLLTCCVPLCFWAAAFGSDHSAMRVAKSLPHGNGIWNLRKVMHEMLFKQQRCHPEKVAAKVVFVEVTDLPLLELGPAVTHCDQSHHAVVFHLAGEIYSDDTPFWNSYWSFTVPSFWRCGSED